MSFALTKYQKRFWITIAETGERIYTPPDFIRLTRGRSDFDTMLADLNAGGDLFEAVLSFERRLNPRKRKVVVS
ncbi:hypothetical protein [Methylobacterium haplocladii]|uniref:Uncharacterized protein n=1 Tax=Methylobacterium haplocladii TaxID=1176176 RepID=A0A512IS39_9HYPH|nr:hypothetical protein [Methylobacterium haplocladii]GEP00522.1 hypothetical protein MHA02_29090 [Methylobacterium haplocladii]GJD85437.1 hypothetical protein HPGCJGGD_3326 [Methylobacterium haplocladii]GLS57822.1 hypothetical protein GCM10007887_04780 [Methylobacterium haplocladii]